MSNVAVEMDQLRIVLSEVDVLSMLTEATYDQVDWTEPDPEVVEAVATLLGLIKKSASAAMSAYHRLHGAVADAAPAPSGTGEAFDYSDGTAPGSPEAMSEPDAMIVQRIRTRCPDNRFEGSSDVELLQLFRRNKRVLARSDEDVIAAMVNPR